MTKLAYWILGFLVIGCTSCASVFWQPMQHKDARVGEIANQGSLLKSLPEPKEQIIAAVYQFRDQTGQYKPSDGGSSFSTAVTQGGATVLVKVLEDSKWFAPIERENIGNLLNERKIVRSTRQQYGLNEELPALLYAGVMLEGGIISYDANVVTGGAGLRYFGTGGSAQYRQDRVTVYLRAISTSNGKILKTVYASKMILSQAMDGGVFRYVSFRRLLEAETGFTYNEPSEMAITEAIEKAVYSLIIEGIEDNLWEMKELGKKKEVLDLYKKELEESEKTDVLGHESTPRRRKSDIGLSAHNLLYKGDYARGRFQPGVAGSYAYHLSPRKALGVSAYSGTLSTKGGYQSRVRGIDLLYTYHYLPWYKYSPFIQPGVGLIFTEQNPDATPLVSLNVGVEYLAKPWLGIRVQGGWHQSTSDRLDGVEQGISRDFFYSASLGLHVYFGSTLKDKQKSKTTSAAPPAREKGVLKDF